MPQSIHKFEEAGLGAAPFQIIGVEERVGPIRGTDESGITISIGAPGQAMGSCDFCGTAILSCEVVKLNKKNHAICVDLDGPTFLASDRSPSVRYEDGAIWAGPQVWGAPQSTLV